LVGGCGTRSGKLESNKCGKVQPKYAPSRSILYCVFGIYTSSHLGQNILTLLYLSSSLMPTGITLCLSQLTRGQVPNLPSSYFFFISARPLGVSMYLAWMSPYRSAASWYTSINFSLTGCPRRLGLSWRSFPYSHTKIPLCPWALRGWIHLQ